MFIEYPLDIAKNLIYQNQPTNIVLVDARNKEISLENLNKIHQGFGLKMYGFHFYIRRDGSILGGRPERALPCDVTVLFEKMYGIKTGNSNQSSKKEPEIVDNSNIVSSNKIFICIENDTNVFRLTSGQETSMINLCRDLMGRYRNIRNIYSLSELIRSTDNLGPFVDMNTFRSEVKKSIPDISIDVPSGISYTFGSRNLFYDSEQLLVGNDVKSLQTYMRALGIPVEKTSGIYDLFTHNSVMTFQRIYQLEITGEFRKIDFDTITKLVLSLDIKVDYSNYHRLLKYIPRNPIKGKDVIRLQKQLMSLKYDVDPTEEFDLATEEAIKSFQLSNGLTDDGIVGPITWEFINNTEIIVFTRVLELTNPMMTGKDVSYIQKKIKDNARRFNITITSSSGSYDQTTYNNVRKIQMMNNMEISGKVDSVMWKFLDSL